MGATAATAGPGYLAQALLFLIFLCPSITQGQVIRFDPEERDLGRVPMQDTLLAQFRFVNQGRSDLTITAVESDCACTEITYPRWAIGGGEGGTIKVAYLPYRPGKFHKQFLVKTSLGTSHYIVLKGQITAPAQPERDFIHPIGPFRAASKWLSFGQITNRGVVTKRFELYNASKEPIIMTGKMELPPHLKVRFDTAYIAQPQSLLPLFITFDPKIKNEFGFVQDEIILYQHLPKDKSFKPFSLRIIATVEEYFPPLTEEVLAEMPQLDLSYNSINLGTVGRNEQTITRFIITNTGKTPLKIRKIEADEGCQVLNPPNQYSHIPAGESVSLRVQFSDLGQTGKVSRLLTLLTNDPRQTRAMLEITAQVR
ncbi:MAG: DUF1573 domain-containing protein [Bernardetiaceae bacterium]